jgi:DNA-directed RNA polymerase sigma subunit (sigma70/sigma32)
VVIEPYRSKKEVDASGRRRIRVSSLDEPVNADDSDADADFGDTFADHVASEDRLYPDALYSAPFDAPDAGIADTERKRHVQALLDGATPALSADERAVFTTMRGLIDGIERTAPETAHILNLSAVRTKQLADQALRKVKAGALGERFFSAPDVVNLDKAAEWKVRQGAKRGRP